MQPKFSKNYILSALPSIQGPEAQLTHEIAKQYYSVYSIYLRN